MLESVGFMYMCIRVRADVSAVCAHAVAGSCCQLCSALRTLSSGCSQTFSSASAFNQNVASWNVLRVNTAGWASTWTSAAALSACNAGAIYTAWGATFQGVWPTLNFACTVGSVACALCITNGSIGAAVTAWATSPTTAATTYGNIGDWNTAAVTSMASVLASRPTFNADISKWNTASVSNMYQVCALS
jgi:hypothetical protein